MSARVVAIARLAPAMAAVCEVFRCTPRDLLGRRRHGELVQPRHVLMWLAVTRYHLSLPAAGRAIGGKHHSTVLAARRRIAAQLEHDQALQQVVRAVEARIVALEAPAS